MISKLMKKDNRGFTLMEMLIVVAIIAILVAIMIPTMTNQLEKARQTADLANIRSAYAEAMVEALQSDTATGKSEFTLTKTHTSFDKVTVPDYLQKGEQETTNGNSTTVEVKPYTGWDDVTKSVAKDKQTFTLTVDGAGVITYAKKTTTT